MRPRSWLEPGPRTSYTARIAGSGGSIRRWATADAPSDYLGLRLARPTCEAVSALAARMAGIDGFARFLESRCCRPGHAGQQQEAGPAGAERSGGEADGARRPHDL